MGYIAKGSITLDNINDAYTVSLSKSSCVIQADFDGSNPKLDDARTTIKVLKGDKEVAFDCVVNEADSDATATITTGSERLSALLSISSLPADTLNGEVSATITTDDGFVTIIQFTFAVMREATMLDWIKDWEGSKTKVGGTYIMTPKLFIGKKDQYADYAEGGANEQTSILSVPGLTGVYIGPDSDSTGIYGYKDSVEIFHLSNEGGMIGGWTLNSDGIYSKDGLMSILSEGAIKAVSDTGRILWNIKSDGSATFSQGNVMFGSDGHAEFTGKIIASDGSIGGWTIGQTRIYKDNVYICSSDNAIGVLNSASAVDSSSQEPVLIENIKNTGGVAIHYTSNSDWGLVGYSIGTEESSGSCVFSLGSMNKIAGWSFDNTAFWSGTKNNTNEAFTIDGITIGTAGMRGQHWYIDNTGDISFMDGQIKFSMADNGGNIVGWMLNDKRFSTSNIAILSDSTNAGIYLSGKSDADFNTLASSSLVDYVKENGGLYAKIENGSAILSSYNSDGSNVFQLCDGTNKIADWFFDGDALYIGTKSITSGQFTSESGSITISRTGIRGHNWRLEADGSGALAGENVKWDSEGNINFNMVVSANNIAAGTISTADIQNATKTWYLLQDGSGALANGNIAWGTDGAGTIAGGNFTWNTDGSGTMAKGNITWDTEGAGTLAGGNILWTKDGALTCTAGTFENVVIKGSNRSPFVRVSSSNIESTSDCLYTPYLYSRYEMSLPWDEDSSGRKFTIAGGCSIDAPSGYYFYEDGRAFTHLASTYEVIELLGYGDPTFKGYVVLNRAKFQTTYSYGRKIDTLACGTAITEESNKVSLKVSRTFDDSEIYVTRCSSGSDDISHDTSEGVYYLWLPKKWFSDGWHIHCIVTGFGVAFGRANPCYAGVCKIATADYKASDTASGVSMWRVEIRVADDSTQNEGGFMFEVKNNTAWSTASNM